MTIVVVKGGEQMAVSRVIRTQMRLVLEEGNHPVSGDVILKSKSFSNVRLDATPDELYAVGNALAGLQSLPLFGIERYDYSEIDAS